MQMLIVAYARSNFLYEEYYRKIKDYEIIMLKNQGLGSLKIIWGDFNGKS